MASELRVSEKSVRDWRRRWTSGCPPTPRTSTPPTSCAAGPGRGHKVALKPAMPQSPAVSGVKLGPIMSGLETHVLLSDTITHI
ncbi:hypothetical protein [Winogradskya humida]|uniref:hypothetical protein n=1 Tax=Winogradskya humida TaxID=113566 RepID=UPI0034DB28DC